MAINSSISQGRGGSFVNKNKSFTGSSIIGLEITMPHAQIPNTSATNGILKQTGPSGVLNTLLNMISNHAKLLMHDALGSAMKNSAGNPTSTIWNVWVESDIPSSNKVGAKTLVKQIEQSIRQIPPTKFPNYTFNTVTVAIGKHYDP